jgi:urease alpha subunit
MPAHFDLLIRRGTCVLPWGVEATDVGVRNGRIAALGVPADATADATIDAGGLHVLPGLIDPHVHLRDPGDKTVETIPTGTRAAVLGGLATVFDMPNTAPSITDSERLATSGFMSAAPSRTSGSLRSLSSDAAYAASRFLPAVRPAICWWRTTNIWSA